jgi:NDP-sugar pyrophosphorylase family protein
MEYVCLAAGLGTRMGGLGRYLQKCMYPIGLHPFLEYSIRNLVLHSHFDPKDDRLTLIVGHHQEQIRSYFGSEYQGLKIGYVQQQEQLGTSHAVHLAYERLQPNGPIIVWLADLYVPIKLFEEIRSHPSDTVQTLAVATPGTPSEIQVTVENNTVKRSWKGSSGLADIGLWKLAPDILGRMMERHEGEYRIMPNLQHAIESGKQIAALMAKEWVHLGGNEPSTKDNLRAVIKRVLELEWRT